MAFRSRRVARALIIIIFGWSGTTPSKAQDAVNIIVAPAITPRLASSPIAAIPAPQLSPLQAANLLEGIYQQRKRLAEEAQAKMPPTSQQKVDSVPVRQTSLVPIAQINVSNIPVATNAPETLRIGQNNRNTVAQTGTSSYSWLAEPAAINYRDQIVTAGNLSHGEYSTNRGATWSSFTLPVGPASASIQWGDNDMVIDDASKTGFHSALYLNSARSNGIVRIFVRPATNLGTFNCYYDINPSGTANNILPDYPHMGLSKNFLYLAINAVGSGGGFARMYRLNLLQMQNCQVITSPSFVEQSFSTFGQRVWVPAEGANNETRMLWTQHDNDVTIRIFDWPETSSPTSMTRTLQQSNFSVPDCRGGIGNYNFFESVGSGITGFGRRCTVAKGANQPTGVLACYWHSAPIGGITQGHVRSAVFSLSGLGVVSQPHIWNSSTCFGYPAVTGNGLGDIGISIAVGGMAGGGGTAAQGYVGIADQYSGGDVGFFGTVYQTASGVANNSSGRFGDYFTIHPYQLCTQWFGATSYAWDKAPVSDATSVNTRWVEFGREAYLSCYNGGPPPPSSNIFGPPTFKLSAFAPAAGGWNSNDTYPRVLADVNGDGIADIVAFGYSGVYVSLATGGGNFAPPTYKLSAYAPGAGGWTSNDIYPRVLADVNGDRMADIVAFGYGGVYVSLATGGGNFAPPVYKLSAFAPGAGGWSSNDTYPRVLADVNGDGMADIVAFGYGGVYVSLATGGGNFAPPVYKLSAFAPGAGGWSSNDTYPRVLADVNGDGLADIVAFGYGGVYVSLAAGGGNFAPPVYKLSAFAPGAGGWSSNNTYPRVLADVNGDRMADIVAFGNAGVYVARASGSGNFAQPVLALSAFAPGAGGWNSNDTYPRVLADVNGDRMADIVAFGYAGVYVSLATGAN